MALPMNCQEKTGFLILHKCKNAADSQCSQCVTHIMNARNLQFNLVYMTSTDSVELDAAAHDRY